MRGMSAEEEHKAQQGRTGGAREEAGKPEQGRREPPSHASGKSISS